MCVPLYYKGLVFESECIHHFQIINTHDIFRPDTPLLYFAFSFKRALSLISVHNHESHFHYSISAQTKYHICHCNKIAA